MSDGNRRTVRAMKVGLIIRAAAIAIGAGPAAYLAGGLGILALVVGLLGWFVFTCVVWPGGVFDK